MEGGKRDEGSSHPLAECGGLGSFGSHGSLLSSVFGGKNPFDDPFFTRPLGNLLGGSPYGGMLESSLFRQERRQFPNHSSNEFTDDQQLPPEPHPKKRRGTVIQELNSDDDDVCGKNDLPRKHVRLEKKPDVVDAEADEKKIKKVRIRKEYNGMSDKPSQFYHMVNQLAQQPGTHCITVQCSSITYGGIDGAYYTKSTTMRTGSDGLTFQEHKEADSTTGRATHQISKGLHSKGHTLTRKLKSDGGVDSMQMLHNLNQYELAGFEETWKTKAKKHLPGVDNWFDGFASSGSGGEQASRERLALPSTEEYPLVKPRKRSGKRAWSEMTLDLPASHPQRSRSRKSR